MKGPSNGIVDMLLESIEGDLRKARENGTHYQKTPIRPSNAGKCSKELYFDLMEYSGRAKYPTELYSGEQDLLFSLGHTIEASLISKFRKHLMSAEVKYTQQSLDFGYVEAVNDKKLSQHIEGSIDLVLWSDEWKCCIDIKSKGDNYDFRQRKMKWDADSAKYAAMKSVQVISKRAYWVEDLTAFIEELNDPFFAANFKQLNMYLNSEFLKSRGVEFGAIIQYHKNKSKLREIRFKPSQVEYEKVMNKFSDVIRAVDEGRPELAKAEYPSESFKARYCNFCKAGIRGSCANKD